MYYLRDKHGEPMMAYPDIYEGREALKSMPRGTELVRASDGAVVSVQWHNTNPQPLRFNLKRMG